MCDDMTVAQLTAEVERLKAAIREHKDQQGDNRCWLDDEALYRAAGLGNVGRGETALPPKCDFLASCERFWRQRQAPLEHGTYPMPGGMTIAQLGAEVERLKARCEYVIMEWTRLETLRIPFGVSREHPLTIATAHVTSALAAWDREHPAGAHCKGEDSDD